MGFNVRHLPSFKELKARYDEYGHTDFVFSYSRSDAFIGSAKAISFVQKMLNKKTNKKKKK